MRLLRVQFTVRWLMIAVAIAAILSGGYVEYRILRRRAASYRVRANEHAAMEEMLRYIGSREGGPTSVDISPGPGLRSKPFPIGVVIAHEAELRRKYEHAAARPWLPVAPDPPEPK